MKVVVIGAGIGGIACALAARREDLDVTVIERAPELSEIGAGIQVPPNAASVARSLGILDEVVKQGVVLDSLTFRRYQNGKLVLNRPGGQANLDNYGAPWIVIHRANYINILKSAADEAGVNFRLGCTVASVDFDEGKVTLEGGEVVEADAVVCADGMWSVARDSLLGYHYPPLETGDLAYRGTFTRKQLMELNDDRVNKLCDTKTVTVWLGPHSHAVFYPMKDGQFNMVLLGEDDMPTGTRSIEGAIDEMRARFDGWDDILVKIISCIPSAIKWKLCHFKELPKWVKGRAALLGDACHPTLPYQAQGAAMAVEDGAVLGKLLGLTNRLRGDGVDIRDEIPRTLMLYESIRKARTTGIVARADDNQHWYHLPDGPEQENRDAAAAADDNVYECDWSALNKEHYTAMLGFNAVVDCEKKFDEEVSRRTAVAH